MQCKTKQNRITFDTQERNAVFCVKQDTAQYINTFGIPRHLNATPARGKKLTSGYITFFF